MILNKKPFFGPNKTITATNKIHRGLRQEKPAKNKTAGKWFSLFYLFLGFRWLQLLFPVKPLVNLLLCVFLLLGPWWKFSFNIINFFTTPLVFNVHKSEKQASRPREVREQVSQQNKAFQQNKFTSFSSFHYFFFSWLVKMLLLLFCALLVIWVISFLPEHNKTVCLCFVNF